MCSLCVSTFVPIFNNRHLMLSKITYLTKQSNNPLFDIYQPSAHLVTTDCL